jgi:hypothetical protein
MKELAIRLKTTGATLRVSAIFPSERSLIRDALVFNDGVVSVQASREVMEVDDDMSPRLFGLGTNETWPLTGNVPMPSEVPVFLSLMRGSLGNESTSTRIVFFELPLFRNNALISVFCVLWNTKMTRTAALSQRDTLLKGKVRPDI